MFTPETLEKMKQMLERYPDKRSALLPILHLAQAEIGWLPKEAMEEVATLIGIPPIKVYEVVSFYTMFYDHPIGRNHIQLCTNISCHLLGSDHLLRCLEKKLGIEVGGTTKDMKFTLTEVQCLGACEQAPVLQLNDEYIGNLTEAKLDEVLEKCK